MAEGMIAGMVSSGSLAAENIYVTNRSNQERLDYMKETYGVEVSPLQVLDLSIMDVIILAMKPKDVPSSLENMKQQLQADQIIISVAAGIQNEDLEHFLHEKQPVIRIMPNTSSTIGESATAVAPGSHVETIQLELTVQLVETMGEAYVIQEKQMDVFTGIAGSGPAYFYKLMEHIEKAGLEAGFDAETARRIGTQTMMGAAKMLVQTKEEPAQLRANITSPNGTTAAGLQALSDSGAGEAMEKAIQAAADRSQEISQDLKSKLLTT